MKKLDRRLCQIDFSAWSDAEVETYVFGKEDELRVGEASESAQRWWRQFLGQNKKRAQLRLVAQAAAEIAIRGKTLTDFYTAYVFSNTSNISANLFFMDYISMAGAKDFQITKSQITRYASLKAYAQRVFEHPAVAEFLATEEYRGLSEGEQARKLLELVRSLGIAYLESEPKEWLKAIKEAYSLELNFV